MERREPKPGEFWRDHRGGHEVIVEIVEIKRDTFMGDIVVFKDPEWNRTIHREWLVSSLLEDAVIDESYMVSNILKKYGW